MDGHGSHVAGIIGGTTYGVAKKVQLVSVKIDVKADQMIKALDFVLKDVKANKREGKAIISMSMHVHGSEIVDRAFKHVVDSGVVCVVSAGNGGVSSQLLRRQRGYQHKLIWTNSRKTPEATLLREILALSRSGQFTMTAISVGPIQTMVLQLTSTVLASKFKVHTTSPILAGMCLVAVVKVRSPLQDMHPIS